jgi:precorrin-3B synthase
MTARANPFSQRRGACPGLSTPMPTGDGLLVRLHSTGTIPVASFAALCAAARECGNGVVEITARGSIQVRGLNAGSAPRFAAAVAALNIAAADGVPVLTNALAGLDSAENLDTAALAADLRGALARGSIAAKLAPKVSVIIDGGGVLSLDGVAADIRLHAERIDGAVVLLVSIAGDESNARALGAIAPGDGVAAVGRLLDIVARGGHTSRARDVLATSGIEPFHAAIAGLLQSSAHPRLPDNKQRAEPIGIHRLRDGWLACGIGLAFGHADAATLEQLAATAEAFGAGGMRAAGRTLMVIGLTNKTAPAFVAAAERQGFIVRADDPRCRVITCAGAPICTSALIAARAIAPAAVATAVLNPALTVHLSGCAKGCAHSGKAVLTIVGTPVGCAIVANGTVRDAPFAMVATDELPAAIARYASEAKREDSHV